jgi:signal transduction histidine kinase
MTGWPADSRCEAEAGEQELISELFHALNQPLTTLQISLEPSLQRPRSEEEYQQTLRRALHQAQEIAG